MDWYFRPRLSLHVIFFMLLIHDAAEQDNWAAILGFLAIGALMAFVWDLAQSLKGHGPSDNGNP